MESPFTPWAAALLLALPALAQDGSAPAPAASPEQAPAAQAEPVGATDDGAVEGAIDPAEPTESAEEEARDRELLGPRLYVNGERVPDDRIKHLVIYGPGQLYIDTARMQVLLDNEVPLLAAQGHDAESFVVTDEELEAEIEKKSAEFEEKYPTLDLDTEIRRAHGGVEWFRQQLRQTMQFDRMFLPNNPADWPEITVESIRADAGDFWLEDAEKSYQNRLQIFQTQGGEFPKEDSMYLKFMREIIVGSLTSLASIQGPPSGIPDDVALVVNDKVFETDEMFTEAVTNAAPFDVYHAKRWAARVAAARQALQDMTFFDENGEERSAWMDDEEWQAYWSDFKTRFTNSSFTLEAIALSGQAFPSTPAYAQYLRLFESWKRTVQDELERGEQGELPEVLRKQLERTNRNLGLGMIDVEMILIAAFDFDEYRWKDDGWGWAKEKAEKLKAALDQQQKDYADYRRKVLERKSKGEPTDDIEAVEDPNVHWVKMLENHSEFWDPPPPATGKSPSMVGYKMKGRFGEKTRNDLARHMNEYFYSDLCWSGDSVTNYVFYEQIPNTVAGPIRGPWGYYITKLNRRRPPSRPLDLSNEKHYQLLVDDWLREAFIDFLEESWQKAEIQGLNDVF